MNRFIVRPLLHSDLIPSALILRPELRVLEFYLLLNILTEFLRLIMMRLIIYESMQFSK